MTTKQLPTNQNKDKADKDPCHAVDPRYVYAGPPPWPAMCGAEVTKERHTHSAECIVCVVCNELAPVPHP